MPTLNEINIFDNQSGEFVIEDRPVPTRNYPENYKEHLAALYELTTGVPYSDAKMSIDLGYNQVYDDEARSQALVAHETNVDSSYRLALASGESLDTVDESVAKSVNIRDSISKTESPVIASELFRTLSDEWDDESRLNATRLNTIAQAFEAKLDDADTSIFGYGWAITDLIFSGLPEILSGGGFTRANYAQKLFEAAQNPDVPEEQFNQMVHKFVNEVADSGWLSNNNPIFTSGFADVVAEGGKGPSTELDKFGTALDILGTIPALTAGAKGISAGAKAIKGTRDLADTVKIFKGNNAATQTVINSIKTGTGGVNVPKRMYGDPYLQPVGTRRYPFLSPDAEAVRIVNAEGDTFNAIYNQDFGSFLDQEILKQKLPEFQEILRNEIDKTETRRINTIEVNQDKFGNLFGEIRLGKADGSPFKKKSEAQKQAKQFGGEVVEAGTDNGKTVYLVSVTKNLPGADIYRPISSEELGLSLFQSFGSSFLTTSIRLDPLIKRGEAALGNVTRKVNKEYNKAFRKVKKGEAQVVDKVLQRLQSGDDSARRTYYTEDEFKDVYRGIAGQYPRQETIDYYKKVVEMNETSYLIQADSLFKDAVNRGEEVVIAKNTSGEVRNIRVVRPKEVPEEGKVYDVYRQQVVDVDPTFIGNGQFFDVVGGYDVGDTTWTRIFVPNEANWNTRRLYHNDVLGYNPGGQRSYKGGNFFVKQDTNLVVNTQAGKRTLTSRPRTYMATNTVDQAKAAAKAAEDIRLQLIAGMPKNLNRKQALKFVKDQIGDPALDDLIRATNSWNPDIEDAEDFIKFLEDYDLDPRKRFGIAARDEPLRLEGESGEFEIITGLTGRETHGEIFNLYRNSPDGRRNRTLLGYGGQELETRSPLERIENGFVRAVQHHSEAAYTNQAVKGWLKGAEPYLLNKGKNSKLPLVTQLRLAEVSDATKEGRKFLQEKRVIERRLSHKSWAQKKWERLGQEIGMWTREKVGVKSGNWVEDQFSGDPTAAMRGMAFNLKLGFLSPDQFFVQSSQIFNILSIAGTDTFKVASAVWPMRLALMNGNEAVIRTIGKNVAFFTGLSEDEFLELVTMFRNSGRGFIDNTVIEQSSGDFALGKGLISRVARAGRFFFNEGELVPREAAFALAYRDFKKKFPGANPQSEAGLNYIFRKQDIYTAGMTQSSAAAWQKNTLSIPLQFMSYTSRMMEQIFLGSNILTPGERAKLALGQFLFWGASGAPFGGSLVNYMAEQGYFGGMDNEVYTTLRYGALDGVIQYTTGADTAFGPRLSVMEGATDMYEKIFSKDTPWYEVATGPVGATAVDGVSTLFTALGQTLTGSWDVAKLDWTRALRNANSVNRFYNSWYIYQLGNYYSRRNSLVADNLEQSEALFNLLGARLQEVEQAYDVWQIMEKHDDMLRLHGKRMQDKYKVMADLIREGKDTEAHEVAKEIAEMFQPLSPNDRLEVRKYYLQETDSMFYSLLQRAIEEGNKYSDIMLPLYEEGANQ